MLLKSLFYAALLFLLSYLWIGMALDAAADPDPYADMQSTLDAQRNSLSGRILQKADPVQHQLEHEPGGWIHTQHRDPVQHQLEHEPGGWIHSEDKNPVLHEMQHRPGGWIHGAE